MVVVPRTKKEIKTFSSEEKKVNLKEMNLL